LSSQQQPSPVELDPTASYRALPASQYNFEQLADLYNRSRVDYIVPMPMNAKRMEEYVLAYDVDLTASIVVLNSGSEEAGLGMLGVRDDRAWITRLGVIPEKRGHKMGQFMMEKLIEQAQLRRSRQVILEVIEGNEPAHHLFMKMGFEETRRLLVLRRPPGVPAEEGLSAKVKNARVTELNKDEAIGLLAEHAPVSSWVDHPNSIVRAGNVTGLKVELESGDCGWLVFRNTPFQLSHLVLGTPDYNRHEVALSLLYHLHSKFPRTDTKLENLPALSPIWPAFQHIGYVESFRRIEMLLTLNPS
jgi:ribosomal protein S18 acetylase RimI-like enzyme